MFDIGHGFFWTLVSDHGDFKNVKFTVVGEFCFVVFVEAYDFSDLSGCNNGIDRRVSGVFGCCNRVYFVERIEI